MGTLQWNGKKSPNPQHKPVVTKELFDKVQSVLKRGDSPKYSKHKFLFTKFLRCKGCGGLISWELQKGKVYGDCNRYRPCTQNNHITEAEVDKQIQAVIANLEIQNFRLTQWIRKALKEHHKEEIEYQQQSYEEWDKKYQKIQENLDTLLDMRIEGRISNEIYDKKFQEYKEKEDVIKETLDSFSDRTTKFHQLTINFYEISQRAKELYAKASDEKKRTILELVFASLELDNGQLIHTYTKPFQLLSEAISVTNNSKVEKIKADSIENFEQEEKIDTAIQMPSFTNLHPDVRRE